MSFSVQTPKKRDSEQNPLFFGLKMIFYQGKLPPSAQFNRKILNKWAWILANPSAIINYKPNK